MKKVVRCLSILLTSSVVVACGGGGGGSAPANSTLPESYLRLNAFNVTSHSDTNTSDSVLEVNMGVNEGAFVLDYSVDALNNVNGGHGFSYDVHLSNDSDLDLEKDARIYYGTCHHDIPNVPEECGDVGTIECQFVFGEETQCSMGATCA